MHLEKSKLIHLGTLMVENRCKRFSYEGDTVSVSECPDTWVKIAGLGGQPRWQLTLPHPGLFLDMHHAKVKARLLNKGVDAGLLKTAALTRLYTLTDDDEWSYSTYWDEATAIAEVYPEAEYRLEQVMDTVATDKLYDHYPLLKGPLLTGDSLLPYVATWLAAQGDAWLCGIEGMWWDDQHAPSRYSAPRGSIFPHRLSKWQQVRC